MKLLAHHTPGSHGLGRVLTPLAAAETSVEWVDPYAEATCRKSGVDMLSNGRGTDDNYENLRRRQRGACRICPAFEHCRTEALSEPPWLFSGFRAGMDPVEHRLQWEVLHGKVQPPDWWDYR